MGSLVQSVVRLLRTVLYGWVLALVRLIRRMCKLLDRGHGRKERERDRRAAKTPCVPIKDPAYVTPDPLIYDQYYLASLGLSYSWDNPDIQLYDQGAPVDSHQLQPNTTYDVVARIWNNSFDAPVVQMPVHLSFLSFGIGTTSTAVASDKVDISVKGGANNPAFAKIPWTTPDTGHYCLQVLLDPVADLDYANNLGQENTDVGVAHSPATFEFALRNATHVEHTYRFEADAYTVDRPPPCDDGTTHQRDRVARHRHGVAPLPPGWAVDLQPSHPTLASGAEVQITAVVTPPAGFHGTQVVNVHAFHNEYAGGGLNVLAGGVTLTVKSEA